ncbi:hypothetical protein Tco_1447592 [Tanacetum coccineum]
MIDELKGKFNGMSIEINKKKELQHLEQVANLSTYPSQRFKSFCYDDDDDYDYEESTIPLNEIDSQIPPSMAITPVLPTLEPEDSLIMGDEHLSTIPEKESDEFIKSSVEDLVPIPSESEDTSGSDSDLPSCDDFSPINVYEEKSVTFSNPLFDSNDDFTSSDDESLSDEDVPEDNDTTTHAENSLPEYDSFHFEIESDQADGMRESDDNFSINLFLPQGQRNSGRVKLETRTKTSASQEATHDCPDFEDSRARCFVHRSLALQSLACLYWESDILNLIN